MAYFSVLISWGLNALLVDIVLRNFIENAAVSYLVSFLIVGFFACLFAVPPGTVLLRVQNNLLLPKEEESRRVDPIFRDVYDRARERTPALPGDIRWFVIINDQPNAAALGRHIIAVTTGLLDLCGDDELAAVFGREFGRIARGDAVPWALMVEGSVIFMVFKLCLLLLLQLVFSLTKGLFSAVNGTDMVSRFFKLAGRALNWLGTLYLSAVYYLALLPCPRACRRREYAADLYSAQLGYGGPLAALLARGPSPKRGLKANAAQMFCGDRPDSGSRVERLRAFAAETQSPKAAVP